MKGINHPTSNGNKGLCSVRIPGTIRPIVEIEATHQLASEADRNQQGVTRKSFSRQPSPEDLVIFHLKLDRPRLRYEVMKGQGCRHSGFPPTQRLAVIEPDPTPGADLTTPNNHHHSPSGHITQRREQPLQEFRLGPSLIQAPQQFEGRTNNLNFGRHLGPRF